MTTNTPQVDDEQPPVSANHCLHCGYDLGKADPDICSECGATIDDAHRALRRVRANLNLPRQAKRHALAWTGVVALYACGVALLSQKLTTAIAAFAAMTAIVGASILYGLVVSLLAPPIHRSYVISAWLRAVWWMHGPWLNIGFCAVVIMIVALVDHSIRADGEAVIWFGMAGLAMWLLVGFVFLYLSFEAIGTRLNRNWPPGISPRREIVDLVLGLGVFLTMLAAAALGLAGGIVSLAAADRMAGVYY